MYKIIGGDGKEYGPVTELELNKWIAEGRLSAQSLAQAEGDAQFRPLATFPEFAGAFGTAAPLAATAAASSPAVDWNTHDYELDIGGCISRGWTLFWDNLGLLFGCSALYLIIFFGGFGIINALLGGLLSLVVPDTVLYSAPFMIAQSVVLQAIAAVFVGPLTGGYYYVFIQTLRGGTATVGDLFCGFQRAFSRLYLGLFLSQLLVLLCWIPFNIVFSARASPLLVHMKHVSNPREISGLYHDLLLSLGSTAPVALLCLLLVAYVATSFWFTLPLIVDQDMEVLMAMGTSFKMVHRHWFTVFGLVLPTVIIYFGGICLCCIPGFFTVGIATAATMFAYETMFCEHSRT
jgi:hypothetical protein